MTTSNSSKPPPSRLFSTAPRWPSSRRNNPTPGSSPNSSFRSCSSSAASDSPPATPSSAGKQAAIPFSWEDLPGIPKTGKADSKPSKITRLPLPPAGPRNRESGGGSGRRDPFMAALLECSRDSGGDGPGRAWKKVGRSVSQRFSVTSPVISIHQFSCKRSCSVSDSVVFLPRSRRLAAYDVINKATD